MEKPYNCRAILKEINNGLEVSIPVRKNWLIIIFLGIWLFGWALTVLFLIIMLSGLLFDIAEARLFILIGLIFWSIPGYFVIRYLLWCLQGVEVLTFTNEELTISKLKAMFSKPRNYNLKDAKNFKVFDRNLMYGNMLNIRNNSSMMFNTRGTIFFDYFGKKIRFAGGIDENEANYILHILKEKNLLNDSNFVQI